MIWYRTLSGVLYLCGLSCFLLGVEQIGRAQNCNQIEYGSATCKNAYAKEPVENASGTFCVLDANDDCQPATGSQCAGRWGVAVAGDCIVEALGSHPTHTCYENAFHTFVNVHWYDAHCQLQYTDCKCKWEMTVTSSPLQVCDCYDVENP